MDIVDELPEITHEIKSQDLKDFITLPHAKFIETPGLHGITTLQAIRVEPSYEGPNFDEWRQVGDFQFKMMISPQRKVIRIEMYDPLMFSILLEQLIEKGYEVISSGEDVEFHPNQSGSGGWLGWAHLKK